MSVNLANEILNVEIEVNSRCNRKCWYCPVSVLPWPDAPIFMSDEVFIRLHEELRRIGYAGRISYHFLSEPLLRKDLPRLVALSKSIVPESWQVLFTNGDLLTDEKYDALMKAGMDLIVVTAHDGVAPKARERQVVQFPTHLQLTNRGGTLEALPEPTDEIKTLPCHAPAEMLIVTADGDVLLCYEDSKREHAFGNIMQSSLEEIWMEPRFVEWRRLVSSGSRAKAGAICERCSNAAHSEPGRSARSEPFWTDLTAPA
jgi:2-deoxy-scyllo-inosamine dehydrogenase (SAM-dependent)